MGVGVGIMGNIVWMVGGRIGLERKKGKGSDWIGMEFWGMYWWI